MTWRNSNKPKTVGWLPAGRPNEVNRASEACNEEKPAKSRKR